MNRYMIIVIGKQFVHPMFISGDSERMFDMLACESKHNDMYIYLIYKENERNACYLPYKTLKEGVYTDFTGYLVQGVVYNG